LAQSAQRVFIDGSVTAAVESIREKLPKAEAHIPQGTYILWVDFPGYGFTPDELQRLDNHNAIVIVPNGFTHDPKHGGQYLWLCLTSLKAVVFVAIDRISGSVPNIACAFECNSNA
jgi:cystathionine beta-lyase